MKAGIVLFPGINRERDMAIALERAAGHAPRMVWHTRDRRSTGSTWWCMPGGFSYGDYLRCGAMAAQSPVMSAVRDHAARGGYVLGVCNGFQILTEAGLLPGALLRNAGLRFISARLPSAGGTRRHGVQRRATSAGSRVPRADGAWRRQLLRRRGDPRPAGGRGAGGVPLCDPDRGGHAGGQPQRQRARHRRHLQPEPARARPDAAPRGSGRSADGRRRTARRLFEALAAA